MLSGLYLTFYQKVLNLVEVFLYIFKFSLFIHKKLIYMNLLRSYSKHVSDICCTVELKPLVNKSQINVKFKLALCLSTRRFVKNIS